MERSDTTMDDQAALTQNYPELHDLLIPLLRASRDDLSAFLVEVEYKAAIGTTATVAHCYYISLDGNKRPRVRDFAQWLSTRIVDFAIPRSEINRAMEEDSRNKSTVQVSSLNNKARQLFSKVATSGEGGEVLLSALAEVFLRLPQLFTKMSRR